MKRSSSVILASSFFRASSFGFHLNFLASSSPPAHNKRTVKTHHPLRALFLFAALVSTPALAQNALPPRQGSSPYPPSSGDMSMSGTAAPKTTPEPYVWLTKAEEAALSDTVPPPPAPSSEQDHADLEIILKVQDTRTPAIIAECKLDQLLTYKLFQPIYGADLTPANSPQFHLLMKHVLDATHAVNDVAKEKYKRLRPYVAHPDVVKPLFTVKGFSYPSGHSMASYTLALVLAEVFPDKKQALLDRAQAIAQSRVDAGVHHPSDIKQGEPLGRATAAAIIASPAFQKDLAAVKAELQK